MAVKKITDFYNPDTYEAWRQTIMPTDASVSNTPTFSSDIGWSGTNRQNTNQSSWAGKPVANSPAPSITTPQSTTSQNTTSVAGQSQNVSLGKKTTGKSAEPFYNDEKQNINIGYNNTAQSRDAYYNAVYGNGMIDNPTFKYMNSLYTDTGDKAFDANMAALGGSNSGATDSYTAYAASNARNEYMKGKPEYAWNVASGLYGQMDNLWKGDMTYQQYLENRYDTNQQQKFQNEVTASELAGQLSNNLIDNYFTNPYVEGVDYQQQILRKSNDPTGVMKQIVGNKTAYNQAADTDKQGIADKTQPLYKWLRDAGYGEEADKLEGMTEEEAKQFINTFKPDTDQAIIAERGRIKNQLGDFSDIYNREQNGVENEDSKWNADNANSVRNRLGEAGFGDIAEATKGLNAEQMHHLVDVAQSGGIMDALTQIAAEKTNYMDGDTEAGDRAQKWYGILKDAGLTDLARKISSMGADAATQFAWSMADSGYNFTKDLEEIAWNKDNYNQGLEAGKQTAAADKKAIAESFDEIGYSQIADAVRNATPEELDAVLNQFMPNIETDSIRDLKNLRARKVLDNPTKYSDYLNGVGQVERPYMPTSQIQVNNANNQAALNQTAMEQEGENWRNINDNENQNWRNQNDNYNQNLRTEYEWDVRYQMSNNQLAQEANDSAKKIQLEYEKLDSSNKNEASRRVLEYAKIASDEKYKDIDSGQNEAKAQQDRINKLCDIGAEMRKETTQNEHGVSIPRYTKEQLEAAVESLFNSDEDLTPSEKGQIEAAYGVQLQKG